MAKKRKKKKPFNLIGFLAIFAVVLTIAIVTWSRGLTLKAQLKEYENKKIELNQKIDDEKERTVELEEKKKYIQTKQYTEEVAKEKFNLVYPDEVILKRKDK